MAIDRALLTRLVGEVDHFYVRDRALQRAQAVMNEALAGGGTLDARAVQRYLHALQRYFSGFEREARMRLADVERRLARARQLQFNLTAECSVAARRVEVTQGVLGVIAELARR